MSERIKGKVLWCKKNGLFLIKGADGKEYMGHISEINFRMKYGGDIVYFIPGGNRPYKNSGEPGKFLEAKDVKKFSMLTEEEQRKLQPSTDPELKKAVLDYYEWQGDKRTRLFGFVRNKKSGYEMLLVQFMDKDDVKMSALMTYDKWKDGHYDVTEVFSCPREEENEMIADFENSQEYV